jgi:anti-anti-sigma factor
MNRVTTTDGVSVIRLPRSADAAHAFVLHEQFRSALQDGARGIVVDFAATEAIDAAGLYAVVRAHKALGVGNVLLVCVGDAVTRMLTLTRLDRVLHVRATTTDDAVWELAGREYHLCAS